MQKNSINITFYLLEFILVVNAFDFVRHPGFKNYSRNFDFCVQALISDETVVQRVAQEASLQESAKQILQETEDTPSNHIPILLLHAFLEHRVSLFMVMREEVKHAIEREHRSPQIIIVSQACDAEELSQMSMHNGTYRLTLSFFNAANPNDWSFYFSNSCPSSFQLEVTAFQSLTFSELEIAASEAKKYLCPGGVFTVYAADPETVMQIVKTLGSPFTTSMERGLMLLNYPAPRQISSTSMFLRTRSAFIHSISDNSEQIRGILQELGFQESMIQEIHQDTCLDKSTSEENMVLAAHASIWELITSTENCALTDRFLVIDDESRFVNTTWNNDWDDVSLDILWLGYKRNSNLDGLQRVPMSFFQFSEFSPLLMTGPYAYVVTKRGARRLLQLFKSQATTNYNQFMTNSVKNTQAFHFYPPIFYKDKPQSKDFDDIDASFFQKGKTVGAVLNIVSPKNGSVVELGFCLHLSFSVNNTHNGGEVFSLAVPDFTKIRLRIYPCSSLPATSHVMEYSSVSCATVCPNAVEKGCQMVQVEAVDKRDFVFGKTTMLYLIH